MKDMRTQFNTGAEAWADYNQRPKGRIRREVTWHNLAPYLPEISDADDPPTILDAGGGAGELALRLAERGYQVWLLDYAASMLEQARQAAHNLSDEARARLTLCPMAVEDAPRIFGPRSFDAITCHTLIEYLSAPRATLRTLSSLLRDGGLLSVSFVNRHSEVLRRIWSQGDPDNALAMLEADDFCASLFDISGVAHTVEEVSAWLADLGLTVAAARGVRVFADYVPREYLDNVEFFDSLLRLEEAVACRHPYALLARYGHLLAHKRVECS
jgi:S-adenosylmethionine-dependent methyltransferase